MDLRGGQRKAAHAHLDDVPARLAADIQIERLLLGIEEERLVDHVGEALAHGADHLEIGALVNRVRADQLQRIVVIDKHLGEPAPRLVGEEARIARVGEELLAQMDLPEPADLQGIGLFQAVGRRDPRPRAADDLGTLNDHSRPRRGGEGDRPAGLAGDADVHAFPVDAGADEHAVAGAQFLRRGGAGNRLPGSGFTARVPVRRLRGPLVHVIRGRGQRTGNKPHGNSQQRGGSQE